MKNLVIDARMIEKTGHGIALYVEGVARSLKEGELNLLNQTLLSILGISLAELKITFLISSSCPSDSIVRSFSTHVVDAPVFSVKEWLVIPKVLDELKADLFFNPSFTSFPYLSVPYVQTVHDLNHLYFGKALHKIYYQTLLKKSVHHAVKIFTVSEVMKEDLIKWSGLSPDRFLVTYNRIDKPIKVSEAQVEQTLLRFGVQRKKFFLAIDSLKTHKNISFLKTQNEEWKNALQKISNGDSYPIKLVSAVSNEDLSVLYHECAAFLFPSVYEGFGRPPVEAALSGTMVIASDIPVHREAKTWLTTSNPEAGARITLLKV